MAVKYLVVIAAVLLAAAVITGAFGAHAFKAKLTPEMLAVYETAVQYHFYHALGLLFIAILLAMYPAASLLLYAAVFTIVGVFLFSGSLYVLALSGVKWLGMITPLGGLCFIAAWLTVAIGMIRL